MSTENMSTEDYATEDDARCQGNDEQLFTSGDTTLARQITEDNKIRSPLMRLPVEIRAIILRMVVGEKLVNVNTRETICYRLWEPEGMGEPNWTLARNLPAGDWDSDDNVVNDYEKDRWGHHFNVLNTSHQLYQEAFPIFWRTCQFRFWEKTALTRFASRLGEVQRANLRRLVIMSDVEHSWRFTYIRDPWDFCYVKMLEEVPLRYVNDIVLDLRISRESRSPMTIADCKALAMKNFESFGPLRRLAPKEAKAILSVPGLHRPSIDDQMELAGLEEAFSAHLLDPTVTKVDLVDALSKRIRRLETSEGEQQTSANRCLDEAGKFQMLADRYRETAKGCRMRADQQRATIEELETVLLETEGVDDLAGLLL